MINIKLKNVTDDEFKQAFERVLQNDCSEADISTYKEISLIYIVKNGNNFDQNKLNVMVPLLNTLYNNISDNIDNNINADNLFMDNKLILAKKLSMMINNILKIYIKKMNINSENRNLLFQIVCSIPITEILLINIIILLDIFFFALYIKYKYKIYSSIVMILIIVIKLSEMYYHYNKHNQFLKLKITLLPDIRTANAFDSNKITKVVNKRFDLADNDQKNTILNNILTNYWQYLDPETLQYINEYILEWWTVVMGLFLIIVHLFVLIDILKLLGIIKPTAVISNPIISIDNDYYKENIVPNQTQDQNPINTKFNLLIFISAILILLAIVGIYYKYTKDSKKNNKKNNSMTMINKALIFTFILGLAYYTVITVTQ